jgi:hypothetical protein
MIMPSRGVLIRVLTLVLLAPLFGAHETSADEGVLTTCISQKTPEILAETTDLIRKMPHTTIGARNWLHTIRPGELNVAYNEGRLIGLQITTVRLKIDKLEERVGGFVDPEIARYRGSLLVHILVDLHELRYEIAAVQNALSSCTTCDVNALKRVESWITAGQTLLNSIADIADVFRKAVAGVLHTLDCKPQSPPLTSVQRKR